MYTRRGSRGYLSGFGTVNATSITTTGNVTSGGRFLAADDSESLPGFSYTSDPNTGLARTAADVAMVVGGGTGRIGTGFGVALTAAGSTFTTQGPRSPAGQSTPSALTGNTDNYAINTASETIRISATGAVNLTGIVQPSPLEIRRIRLVNVGANTITLKHEVTSTAANRFNCPGAVDFSLTQFKSVWCEYDTTLSRWMVHG